MKLGSVGVTISMDDGVAEKIRVNVLYRSFVRPVLQYLDNRKNTLQEKEIKVMCSGTLNETSQTSQIEMTPEQEALHKLISKTDWYHSIDLGYGVVTPASCITGLSCLFIIFQTI
ncbi:MAG: hypothetical protein ACFFCW_41540 [Candidatus Hodarchaeota archaeon]